MNPVVPVVPSFCRLRNVLYILCFPLALMFLTLSLPVQTSAQTLAFPGALGFGQNATGGRSGIVYHVNTLADSGTGSFRDAVSHSGRIIVFDVGGYITLQSSVTCANNLTIAGQTAPGGGIGILGHEVSFSAKSNEIVRFLRIRPGSLSSLDEDAINVGDGTNMIFDHVSLEFAGYNNIDAHGNTGSDFVTVQNSIIGDPMSNGTEAKQGFGAHTEHLGGRMSWFYNLWVSEHNRQPLAKIDTVFVNNVLYNFQAGYTVANTSGNFRHDIINNYFITGPTDPTGGNAFFQMNANQTIYTTGNLIDNDNDGTLSGGPIDPGGGYTPLTSPWSPVSTNATVYPTAGAYHFDVSQAGAVPYDQMDSLIISQIKTLGSGPVGTGAGTAGPGSGLYFDQTSTGLGNNGFGVINGGVAAIDSDGDGMPDYWENAVGLNPNNASDAMTIAADGYANIEHYLNWLAAPHALTATNAPIDIDLWQYTGGFTNASPLYVIDSATNATISITGTHVVHFVPTTNFSGLGSFQFTVTANDGSTYSNTVTVLMTPIALPSDLVWQGDGVANLWANGSGVNWSDGTNLVAFTSGDNVTFDDTGTNTPAVNLSGPIVAGAVNVLAEQDYTFAGTGFLSGGTSLFKTGSGQLTLYTTNNFGGGTTIGEGVVQIGDGVTLGGSLSGNITNNDTLIYAIPGTLSSSASISGPGTVTVTGPGSVTISGTQTYTGPTTINAGALGFSGTLPPSDITDNGLLTLASPSQVYSNTISGTGIVVTSPAGVLTLSSSNTFAGNLTNTSGFLVLSNNNAAGLGTVVDSGGLVVVANGITITNNFSIPTSTSDLNMMATNSGTATWAGNVVNLGSSAQWRPGSDGGTLVFLGNAVMGTRNFIVPRGAVQFGSNAVISATGSATALGRDGSAGNRSATVTIRDNATLTFGVCSLGGGDQGGNVTVTIQNNAALTCAGNLDVQNINRAAAISFIRLNGGTLTVNGFTKTKTSQTNSISFNGGVVKAGAANASFLPQFNATTNAVQAGGAIIDDGGFAITIPAGLTHDPALGGTVDGGLTKLDTGTLTLTGPSTYTGPTTIKAGTLALSGLGTFAASTIVYIGPGATLDVSASLTNAYLQNFPGSGKAISGSGSINGNFTLGASWNMGPGSNSIGTLTFNNSLNLATGSSFLKISHSPLTNSSVIVQGTLTNGGTLHVSNVGASPLAAGDTFQLFNAASYTGTFSQVLLPPLPAGLAWNTNALNTSGTISVALAGTPVIQSVSISGGSLGLSGTGGVGNANYILLGSTNLSGSWTPLFTNQFDNSGNFNFTTNADTSMPLNFYRLQLQ